MSAGGMSEGGAGKEPGSDQPGWAAPTPPPPAAPPPAAPAGFPAPPAYGTPFGPGGTTTTRRRRRWPWVLGALLAAIVVLGVTGTVLFVQKIKPPIDAANDYLAALEQGDYDDAFNRLCEQGRTDSSAASFERDIIEDDVLSELDSYSVNPFDVDVDGDRTTVGIDVDAGSTDIDDVLEIRLRKEGGQWKPCGGFYGFTFNFG